MHFVLLYRMGLSFDMRADPKQSLESNATNALHHHVILQLWYNTLLEDSLSTEVTAIADTSSLPREQ